MTYNELKRHLRRLGIERIGERKKHERWSNPSSGKTAMIPRHGRQDPPPTPAG